MNLSKHMYISLRQKLYDDELDHAFVVYHPFNKKDLRKWILKNII